MFVFQVTGEANEKQICESLRRYRERECFTREALVHLYQLTNDMYDQTRPDILKVTIGICLHMKWLKLWLLT